MLILIRNNDYVFKWLNLDGLRYIKVDWLYILYKYFLLLYNESGLYIVNMVKLML